MTDDYDKRPGAQCEDDSSRDAVQFEPTAEDVDYDAEGLWAMVRPPCAVQCAAIEAVS